MVMGIIKPFKFMGTSHKFLLGKLNSRMKGNK